MGDDHAGNAASPFYWVRGINHTAIPLAHGSEDTSLPSWCYGIGAIVALVIVIAMISLCICVCVNRKTTRHPEEVPCLDPEANGNSGLDNTLRTQHSEQIDSAWAFVEYNYIKMYVPEYVNRLTKWTSEGFIIPFPMVHPVFGLWVVSCGIQTRVIHASNFPCPFPFCSPLIYLLVSRFELYPPRWTGPSWWRQPIHAYIFMTNHRCLDGVILYSPKYICEYGESICVHNVVRSGYPWCGTL